MKKRQPKILKDIPVELKSLTKTLITITPKTRILDARNLLLKYKIGRLVVEINNKPIGIITEKDIARSVSVFSKKPIDRILARDIMSKDLITTSLDSTTYDCAKLMKNHNISSVIVVDKGKLVGVVTKTDLVSIFLVQSTASLDISKIMTKKVVMVSPEDSIFEVQSLLFNNKISRIVVTKNKVPVGIITYRDFVPAKILRFNKYVDPIEQEEISNNSRFNEFNSKKLDYLLTFTAHDIMTKEPFVVYANDDIYTAAILMIRNGISGIPVIKNKKLVGIVTKTDIVNVLAAKGKS